jgi:two-component system phosphate regulon sensor histidine kinase PhoR
VSGYRRKKIKNVAYPQKMTQRKIRYIIALMAFALLGLIVFQMFWLGFTVRTKNDQFGSNVRDAMQQVVRKLSQQEMYYFMQRKIATEENKKQLLAISKPSEKPVKTQKKITEPIAKNIPSLAMNLDKMGDKAFPSDILVSKGVEVLPNGEIREHQEYSIDLKDEDVISLMNGQKQLDDIFGEAIQRHNNLLIEDSIKRVKMLISKKKRDRKPHTDQPIQDTETAQKVKNKAEMAKEVFSDFLTTKRSIYDRINYQVLDSLLKNEIKMKGIEIPFEYGISSMENPGYLHYASSMKYKMTGLKNDKDTYEVNLFPNDYSNSENYLRVYFPNQDRYIIRNIWMMYATSLLLILVVLGCFYVAVSTILKQKQLADIKNDFINNMTHEFKTPISTISLATQMLGDEAIAGTPSIFKRYLGIIRDENKRLGSQVEKVLQTAQMERGEVQLKLGTVNVHQIIERVLENISPQIELREGIIEVDLKAENPEIQADEVHLTNIIFNLLDNANKYSPEKPIIKITTENTEKGLSIKVSDQGIGMTKESVKNIFEKFYRVPTGNVHDVKGFGLGLSYVKKMVEEHHGRINVVSKLGEGSEFEVVVPI